MGRSDGRGSARGARIRTLLVFFLAAAVFMTACGGKGDSSKKSDEGGSSSGKGSATSTSGKKPSADTDDAQTGASDGQQAEGEYKVGEEIKNYNLHKIMGSNRRLIATLEEVDSVPFPTVPGCGKAPQGGYFDGRYYYQAFCNIVDYGYEVENEDVIVKYDTVTKQIVDQSPLLKMSHANDITYNPKTDRFLVTHCMGPQNSIVTILTSDLEFERTVDLGFSTGAITYNASRDQYVALASGQAFVILDANFQRVEVYDPTTRTAGYTTQGISSDDNYIYHLFYQQSVISVYDWNGNFVSIIELENLGCEGENVSVIGDDIYVGGGTSGPFNVYKVTSLRIEPEEE